MMNSLSGAAADAEKARCLPASARSVCWALTHSLTTPERIEPHLREHADGIRLAPMFHNEAA
jgi:hypothetical protein